MAANALQLQCRWRMPLPEDRAPRVVQTGNVVYFESEPLSAVTRERLWGQSSRSHPRSSVFLLGMAAVSLIREIGDLLISTALRVWFGVTPDPFTLSLLLQLLVTLVGIGVAGHFWQATPGSATRRHMLLAPVAAMGIGVTLAWLSRFVGYANALDWPLVLVYLAWAGIAAVSGA